MQNVKLQIHNFESSCDAAHEEAMGLSVSNIKILLCSEKITVPTREMESFVPCLPAIVRMARGSAASLT